MVRIGEWMDDAACVGKDPELFFPVGTTGLSALQIEEAKSVCSVCPVVDECLQHALEIGAEYGVWGNATEGERRKMKRSRLTAKSLGKSALGA